MRTNIDGVVGEIDSLPGCSQIAVSHSVYLDIEARGQGFGSQANSKRCELAFGELGYDMMLCTVDAANVRQKKILIKNGWECLTLFISRKTNHTVELWSINR